MNRLQFVRRMFMLAVAACMPLKAALAAEYPVKTVRVVVPFGAGGLSDIITRQLAVGLGEKLGQPVIVENKPGAGHIVSLQTVANAPADGYTLLLGSNTGFTVSPHMYKKLNFDIAGFLPVAGVSLGPVALVARPDFPASSLTEFAKLAKAKGASLNYGSYGVGSSAHIGMEMIKKDLGIESTHIPYKGDAGALQGLLGKEIDVAYVTLFSVQSRILSGELKALGVMQADPIPRIPSIQTTKEAGWVNAEFPSWNALFAPAGTPPSIVKKVEDAVRAVVSTPQFAEFLRGRGAEPWSASSEQLSQFVATQSHRIAPMVKALDLQPGQ